MIKVQEFIFEGRGGGVSLFCCLNLSSKFCVQFRDE